MRKSAFLVYAGLLGAAAWFFLQNFEIQGLEGLKVSKKEGGGLQPVSNVEELPVYREGETIKIASFNIQVFGQAKLSKPHVMDILARTVRDFDIVAVQEIRSLDQDVLPRFVDLINQAGRQYDYVIGPRLGNTDSKEQYAFIFDRASIEVDRTFVYTVNDPANYLHREPFVAWFRVRGPASDQAFTFTLVNVHTDPDVVDREMDVMDDVFRAVRDDGRDEDDVILLGDFNTDSYHMGPVAALPGVALAINGATPTNVRHTEQYDNVIFDTRATREFVGRAGVYDFMRIYGMRTVEEALEVSDHCPVWAEFSIYEGGVPGSIATRPNVETR